MILIADSGSTKTDWVLLHENGETISFETIGFNPFHHDSDIIGRTIYGHNKLVEAGKNCTQLYYYGAGCSNEAMCSVVRKGLSSVFTNAEIAVKHDLEACALATYEGESAISCILGTGSNSCYFDGKKVSQKTPSLGYILGDEGGGSYFGKEVLKAYLYNQFPSELQQAFEEKYTTRKDDILDRIYKQPNAKTFIASYAEFLKTVENHPFVLNMLTRGFEQFLKTHVCCFPESKNVNIHFIGSIAYHFQSTLEKAVANLDLKFGKVIKQPIDGLVEYYLNNQ